MTSQSGQVPQVLDPDRNASGSVDDNGLRFRLFAPGGEGVEDTATGLMWPRQANILGYPLSWMDALEAVAELNRSAFLGHTDWRMPNRRELRSLIDHSAKQPALPSGHPFTGVFLGWYWTSTTKAGQPAYAWNVHFEGGRMFYSRKEEYRLLWPVCGNSTVLPATGQMECYDASGDALPCLGTGQDGELRTGTPWPSPRFSWADDDAETGIADALTGLIWLPPKKLTTKPLTWGEAVALAAQHAEQTGLPWRLPSINELESLVDASRATPALPVELVRLAGPAPALAAEGFWSATHSGFDPAWAFVLYGQKGAVGVGYKPGQEFLAWPVRSPQ